MKLKAKKRLENQNIVSIEKMLTNTNSKSVSLQKFREYANIKLSNFEVLNEYYSNVWFRVLRWNCLKKRMKSEQSFFKLIEKTFGKDPLLCYGLWNRQSQIKGLIPSPTTGFKEKLRNRFDMVDVPEWNTTKTCRLCSGECKEPGIQIRIWKKRKGEWKKIKKETRDLKECKNCGTILNRDRNGALNILHNFCYYEKNGSWDPRFLPNRN
jgi:hypothetical protein